MKVIFYSDVHGNKYALNELINSYDYKSADKRIFLGDMVNFCPYGDDCINLIRKLKDDFVIGNHDILCAYGANGNINNLHKNMIIHNDYMSRLISKSNIDYLKTIPKSIEFSLFDKKFHCTHYLWKDSGDELEDNPEKNSQPSILTAKLFDKIDADYIIFGHNHKNGDINYNNKNFICVGSLGVRYPAMYLIVDINNDNVTFQHKQLYYDITKLKDEIKSLAYPISNDVINFFDE